MSTEQNLQYQPFGYGDPNETEQSDTTRNRKKYPKERHGAKNEWHALIRHQADVNNQIIQLEKELKSMRAQHLDQAYRQKFQQQIQAKEQELQERRAEEELMSHRIALYQQDLAKQKQEKVALQNHLADSYENLINHHVNQSNEEKNWKLEQENRILDENQRRIESEQRRRFQAKMDFGNMAQDQIGKFYDKKYAEQQGKVRFRDEYNQLVNQNIQRDLLKEENYRNYFRLAAQQQRQREDLHTQNVLSQYQQRQQNINNTIDNRVFEANQRAQHKEQVESMIKENVRNDLRSTLLNQMDFKSNQTHSFRHTKTLEAEDSVKKLHGYHQYLQDAKNQKIMGQQLYKDILDRQHQELEENKKANRMTKHEKKINLMDLHAYKQSNYQLHSLVPGLQHSKHEFNGSPALKHIAKATLTSPNRTMLTNSFGGAQTKIPEALRSPKETLGSPKEAFQNDNLYGDTLSTPKNKVVFSPTTRATVASPTYITSTNNALSMQLNNQYVNQSSSALLSGKKIQDPIRENIFYRPPPQNTFSQAMNSQFGGADQIKNLGPSPRNQIANRGSPRSSSLLVEQNGSYHNPITNPMPFSTQNPYILKQLRSIPRSPIS